ncbi:MAG: hypothetical protein KGJ43_01430 [Acidobacteriota bacterium]|nr:hypothetical protein [Acidobacteriota bacterium]
MAAVVIFAVVFLAGVYGSTRWLPDLPSGSVNGAVFFVVCGLVGAAVADAGLHVYIAIESFVAFGHHGFDAFAGSESDGVVVAAGLSAVLWNSGALVALAAILYVLASIPRAIGDSPAGRSDP